MLPEKEKLEEELKLLEESFSLDVITKGEYEEVKRRIENKLKEIRQHEAQPEEKIEGISEHEEKAEETVEDVTEIIGRVEGQGGEAGIEEIGAGNKKNLQEGKTSSAEEAAEEEVIKSIKWNEGKKEKEHDKKIEFAKLSEQGGEEQKGFSDWKESKRWYAYASIALIVAIGLYFFFFAAKPGYPQIDASKFESVELNSCISDSDCIKKGMIGVCSNSQCQHKEDAAVQLTILQAENCFNCETLRVIKIIEGFFPNIQTKNVDFDSEEGKNITENYDIKALPAYIFDSNIKDAYNYEQLATAFTQAEYGYVMKSTVANSNYYIGREDVPNKLDILVKPNEPASQQAEKNLKEFLETFGGKVRFEKHDSNSRLAKELGINTFPAFLVNNKIKFSGVQPAEKIKKNFCEMNNLDECKIELRKSLV